MRISRSLALVILTVFISPNCFATVDYLSVNHLTKQLYWGDTDNSPGWIGWETIPDGITQEKEAEYLEKGYEFTENAYLIEEVVCGVLIIGVVLVYGRRRRLIRRFNPT